MSGNLGLLHWTQAPWSAAQIIIVVVLNLTREPHVGAIKSKPCMYPPEEGGSGV
jgi:hypothetical protein